MRATKVTSPRTSEKGKPTQIDRLRAATRQMSNERADLSVCIDLEQPEHFLPLRLGSIGVETGHVFIKPSRRLGDLAAVLEPIVLSERHDVEGNGMIELVEVLPLLDQLGMVQQLKSWELNFAWR